MLKGATVYLIIIYYFIFKFTIKINLISLPSLLRLNFEGSYACLFFICLLRFYLVERISFLLDIKLFHIIF